MLTIITLTIVTLLSFIVAATMIKFRGQNNEHAVQVKELDITAKELDALAKIKGKELDAMGELKGKQLDVELKKVEIKGNLRGRRKNKQGKGPMSTKETAE